MNIESLPTCIPSLHKFYKNRVNNDILIRGIAKIIEAEKGCDPLDNTSSRVRCLCEARQLLFAMLDIHTKWSLGKIGAVLNKDHATVIHSKNVIRNLQETDKHFKEQFDRINQQVNEFCKYNQ